MADAFRLIGWGLRIGSAVDLPGAAVLRPGDDASEGGTVDLAIDFGSVAADGAGGWDGPYRLDPAGFTFAMPGVARYACTRATVVVDPVPGADVRDVAAMLIATVIPAVLWLRGEVVLHAAAAILPGTTRAVAVLGASGSGKSTLLARAIVAGAQAVADDSIRVCTSSAGFRIGGLPGGYFAPLGHAGDGRTFYPVATDRRVTDADLGAVLVLDGSSPPARLTGAVAVAAVLSHRHRPRIARLLGLDGVALEKVAALCRHVPIVRLSGLRGVGTAPGAGLDASPAFVEDTAP